MLKSDQIANAGSTSTPGAHAQQNLSTLTHDDDGRALLSETMSFTCIYFSDSVQRYLSGIHHSQNQTSGVSNVWSQ